MNQLARLNEKLITLLNNTVKKLIKKEIQQ